MYPVIESIVNTIKPRRYIEVGVWDGEHLMSVDAPEKVGVDILNPPPIDNRTKYICGNSHAVLPTLRGEQFDMIFVDGLHHYEHCIKDIAWCVELLSPGGVIVAHDVYPLDSPDAVSAVPRVSGEWTGDVWKVVPQVLYKWSGFTGYVINDYPGYFVMWPTSGLVRNAAWSFRGIDMDAEHPFAGQSIQWARDNRHIFNVSRIEDVTDELKRRLIRN